MLHFDAESPFPLIPPESHTYAEAQAHSEAVDAWLGIDTDSTERRIQSSHAPGSPQQLWVGLPLRSMLTPYTELRRVLSRLDPAPGQTVIDLGAGYGRMGFVIRAHYPEVSFIGYELAGERVREANRLLDPAYERVKMVQADLSAADFALPAAEYYFLYDYGTRAAISKTLEDLRDIARTRAITVVGRGRASRDAIEREHPWLSQVIRPEHYPHYSIYCSASS